MTEPRNPWFYDVDPDEFKEYYDRKLERIDELSEECKAEGCTNEARWPRETCSNECYNARIRQAARDLEELLDDASSN